METEPKGRRKIVIGVMGPGEQASATDWQMAYQLGQLIAQQGWLLLTGGRAVGVMQAANLGAKQADGLTIGILPTSDIADSSEAVDIILVTGMGNARNAINILSSHVVIVCGMSSGTASEVALAIKAHKPVILLNVSLVGQAFFRELSDDVIVVESPEAAVEQARQILQGD